MAELKIVITGCMGAGKTTAINSISDTPLIATDVDTTDEARLEKDTTTVAMDYGTLTIDDDRVVYLYGTPGQERFAHMWEILAQGALGIVILLNHRREDPLADLEIYLENFQQAIANSTAVIGITHVDESGDTDSTAVTAYYDYMARRGLDYPIFPIDARAGAQVRVMIEAMAAMIQLDEETDEAV